MTTSTTIVDSQLRQTCTPESVWGGRSSQETLSAASLPDGTNVDHSLVKDGWCWWYRKYAPGDTILEGLEKQARYGRKGLWADPQPVPPWAWRKRSR